jgi:hypothetical protein
LYDRRRSGGKQDWRDQKSEQIKGIGYVEEQWETVEIQPRRKLVQGLTHFTDCHVLAFSRRCHVPDTHDDLKYSINTRLDEHPQGVVRLSIPMGSHDGLGQLREWSR